MTPARRWIAAVLAIIAVAALVFAFTGDPTATGAEPAPAGATPLWSARRVPQPIVNAVGAQRLQRALDTEVGGPGVCFMVEDEGATVAATNVDAPLIPASAQKLYVAAAALDVLGPDFTYVTKVVAPHAIEDGAVGLLYLVGSGDPVIASDEYPPYVAQSARRRTDVYSDLEALADAIVAKGVTRIPGGIVGDDSRYDQQRQVDGWSPSYLADGDVGPIGALTVNDGNSSVEPRRTAADPALNAAAKLSELLAARGVQVGAPSRGTAPEKSVEVAALTSAALRDIVGSMLTTSDALTAEMLAKELGVRAQNQGTTAGGTTAITASLQRLGVPLDGVTLLDASGLHRGNRATCRSLLATVGLGAQPKFESLWTGLSVVGQKGTLIDQLLGLNLEGILRAKTGFLSGVTSLVGTIDGADRLEFAYVDNGDSYSQGVAEALRRDAAEVLATFPEAPSADELVPAPL
jgi:serine-type D-Ala-D-Ala carboxypeptidase/endopeptidase (penicillin-binding protein 4)